MTPYYGITYSKWLQYNWVLKLWARFQCPKNHHLFDEVRSDKDHCLVCDACQLTVDIASIDDRDVKRKK